MNDDEDIIVPTFGIKYSIRQGFVDKKYSGSACIVLQPNGNYILITHEMDIKKLEEHNDKFKSSYHKMEYVGDFIFNEYFLTIDYKTDPNIQAKQKQYWRKFYGY